MIKRIPRPYVAICLLALIAPILSLRAEPVDVQEQSKPEALAALDAQDLAKLEELTGLNADELVRRAEDALRGDTAQMRATMHITTPRWERSVEFRSFDDRIGDRAFIRILAPKKEKGTGFLRQSNTLWTYLPRVERTTRIPPSMMMQAWMGSDFTNDDLARESSITEDYTPQLLEPREVEGVRLLGAVLIPHEDAAVVWAKIDVWVVAENFAPFEQTYYDEPEPGEFEVVRVLSFSDVREVQGRPVPHYYRMLPVDKPGNITALTVHEVVYDEEMPDSIFTKKNLKRAEAVR
jgi:hypothetical protein